MPLPPQDELEHLVIAGMLKRIHREEWTNEVIGCLTHTMRTARVDAQDSQSEIAGHLIDWLTINNNYNNTILTKKWNK